MGSKFYSIIGNQTKDTFIQDENGSGITLIIKAILVTGAREIDGKAALLHEEMEFSCVMLQREDENGNQYYYDKTGTRFSTVATSDGQNWRYFRC